MKDINENTLFIEQFKNTVKNNKPVATVSNNVIRMTNSVRTNKSDDSLEMETSNFRIQRNNIENRNLSVYETLKNKTQAMESFKRSLREVYDFNLK